MLIQAGGVGEDYRKIDVPLANLANHFYRSVKKGPEVLSTDPFGWEIADKFNAISFEEQLKKISSPDWKAQPVYERLLELNAALRETEGISCYNIQDRAANIIRYMQKANLHFHGSLLHNLEGEPIAVDLRFQLLTGPYLEHTVSRSVDSSPTLQRKEGVINLDVIGEGYRGFEGFRAHTLQGVTQAKHTVRFGVEPEGKIKEILDELFS